MIHEVQGDILLSDAQTIAHGVAPGDSFNQGLALSLREEWPAMVRDFRHYCQTSHPKPGELWAWAGPGGKRIVNLLTQEPAEHRGTHPGAAKLEHVNHALRALREFIQDEKVTSMALPRLATGVGGLDWDEVRPLIDRHLGDLHLPIYVYTTFRKGQKAEEPSAVVE